MLDMKDNGSKERKSDMEKANRCYLMVPYMKDGGSIILLTERVD